MPVNLANSVPPRVTAQPLRLPIPLSLRIGFWICIVIAVAVVVRRIFALASNTPSSAPPEMAALNNAFAGHAILTLAHILPALIFVMLAPLVIFGRSRFAWAEILLYPFGAMVGLTAYAMSAYAVGGWLERSAVLLFNTLFLFSLIQALRYRLRDPIENRRWLVRSIVVLLGIATTRPVMGVFFATSRLTHLTPNQFFGAAFWIGFSINAIAVELWLRRPKKG